MKIVLFALAVLFPLFLFADDIGEVIPTESWLFGVIGQLSSLKGASALGIAAFAVQSIMKFFKTPLAMFAGKWRLIAVCLLSLASLIVTGMSLGMDLKSILAGSGFLATVQVFINQVWKQFIEKSGEVVNPVGS